MQDLGYNVLEMRESGMCVDNFTESCKDEVLTLFFPLKSMVDLASGFASAFQFWQFALASNWFGLQCPLHCGHPSFAALGFSVTFGFLLGFACCALLGFFLARHFWGFRPSPIPPSPQERPPPDWVLRRLSGYRV